MECIATPLLGIPVRLERTKLQEATCYVTIAKGTRDRRVFRDCGIQARLKGGVVLHGRKEAADKI